MKHSSLVSVDLLERFVTIWQLLLKERFTAAKETYIPKIFGKKAPKRAETSHPERFLK